MSTRPGRCSDCGGRLPARRPGQRGRPPTRCPDCRKIRPHRATPAPAPADLDEHRRLRSVPPSPPSSRSSSTSTSSPAIPPPAEPRPPAPGPLSVAAAVVESVESDVSIHPHDLALETLAQLLGQTLDHPLIRADGRVVATVSRELRATLAELAAPPDKGDGDDDDDDGGGLGDLSTPVHDTAQPG